MSRDYQQSGAVNKCCGGGTEVGHRQEPAFLQPWRHFPLLLFCSPRAAERHSRIWTSGVCQDNILQAQTLLDGGTEMRKDCAPGQDPLSPQPRSVNHLSCGIETIPTPRAHVITALDVCHLLFLSHIQVALRALHMYEWWWDKQRNSIVLPFLTGMNPR